MATEYEARYGEPYELTAFYAAMQLYILTDVLRKAGTVDDMDRILPTIDTETFDTPIAPMPFGGKNIIGLNRTVLWPVWIQEFRGEDWHIIAQSTGDEAKAIAEEVLLK
jgi:hypothetical protein